MNRGRIPTALVATGIAITMAGAAAQQNNFVGGLEPVTDAVYKAAPKK